MRLCLNGYDGERKDPVSWAHNLGNGFRAYHPRLGRFATPDNISPFEEGGMNSYAYCTGDPVNRSDPSGHMSKGQWIGIGIGFVGGIALSIMTDGAALPAVVSLLATMTGEAAIGAGVEIAKQAIDSQRFNWGQVGIAAGIGAMAWISGYGLGRTIRFKELSNRSFGVLMMESAGNEVSAGRVRRLSNLAMLARRDLRELHDRIGTTLRNPARDPTGPRSLSFLAKKAVAGDIRTMAQVETTLPELLRKDVNLYYSLKCSFTRLLSEEYMPSKRALIFETAIKRLYRNNSPSALKEAIIDVEPFIFEGGGSPFSHLNPYEAFDRYRDYFATSERSIFSVQGEYELEKNIISEMERELLKFP